MTGTALREALHGVASVGAGPVDDARLARVADRAKGGEQMLTASRGGGRRRWVVGGLAVAAIGVLVVVGMAHALRPVEATPASGPGSLPDQIFPTREHILTMEQAPIGRVSMVFATSSLTGDAAPAWIAVGADSDEYRWVAPASDHSAYNRNLDVSPDGSSIAIGRGGDRAGELGVEILDVSSGTSSWIALPDDGVGGRVESLRWDLSGERVGMQVSVTNGDDPDLSSGKVKAFVVTVSDGSVDPLPSPAAWADLPVGWGPDGAFLMGNDTGQGRLRRFVVLSTGSEAQQKVGQVPLRSMGQAGASVWSVSPDARLLATLPDLSDDQTGSMRAQDLVVWRLSDGEEVARVPLGRVVLDTAQVVGWRDAMTPVVSYLTRADRSSSATDNSDYVGHVESVSLAGERNEFTEARSESANSVYRTSRLAQDVLAAGEVRAAEPPQQPWYDLRTLGPAVRDTLDGWAGNEAAQGLALVLLVVAGLVLLTRRIDRRRRLELDT